MSCTVTLSGMTADVTHSYDVMLKDAPTNGMQNTIYATASVASNIMTIHFSISSIELMGSYDVIIRDFSAGTTATGYSAFRVVSPSGLNNIALNELHAYPNPAKERLYIEAGVQPKMKEIILTTLDGAVVLNESSADIAKVLDIHGITAGVYILTAIDQDGTKSSKKIVVE